MDNFPQIPRITPINETLEKGFGSASALILGVKNVVRQISARLKAEGKTGTIEINAYVGGIEIIRVSINKLDPDDNAFLFVNGEGKDGEKISVLSHYSSITVKFVENLE